MVNAEQGSVSGALDQCDGFPVPPSDSMTRNGVTFTVGDICHVYSGTVTGVVKGTQYTASFADSSRLIAGQESFEGSVAGRQGTADLTFRGSRPCFPTCPATVHITSTSGARDLEGLQLDLSAVGGASLTYSGTYAFDGPQQEGNVLD